MGVPSLNDLAVDGTLNTTNQPTHDMRVTPKESGGGGSSRDGGDRKSHVFTRAKP